MAVGRGFLPYHQPNYSRLLAFSLDGTAELPPAAEYVERPLDPPPSTASDEVLERGAGLYGQNCVQCHSSQFGTFPDLRRSPALDNPALFDAIVLGGALSENGMASFAEVLTTNDAAAVREYVITLAIEAKVAEPARQPDAATAIERDGPHAE